MTAQPSSQKKIRAVIFSCHNPSYYENTIEPKLSRYNVETVKKIDPNKHSTVNIGDCDVVIVLLELMSSNHVSLIRSQAKAQGKHIISLHRQITDWERAFAKEIDQRIGGGVKPISPNHEPEPRIPAKVSPPPPPSRPMPPPATKDPVPMWGAKVATQVPEPITSSVPILSPANTDDLVETEGISSEYAEWLSLLEEDNSKLTARNKELETNWTKAKLEYEELLKKNIELSTRAASAETTAHRATKELSDSRNKYIKEIGELQALLAKAGKEIEKYEAAKSTQTAPARTDIEKALHHFEEIWKMGVMDAEDILKKLFGKNKQ